MNAMNKEDSNHFMSDEEEESDTEDDINYDDDEDAISESSSTHLTEDTGDPYGVDQIESLSNLDQNPDLAVIYIYISASFRDKEFLLKHLDKGNSINKTDRTGRTALNYAKVNDNKKAMEILLACGAKENPEEPPDHEIILNDNFLFRQLYCAALAENGLDIIKELDYSVDIRNEDGETVLTVLTQEGNYEGVLTMLDAGASVDKQVLSVAQSLKNGAFLELLCTYQDKQHQNLLLQSKDNKRQMIYSTDIHQEQSDTHLVQSDTHLVQSDTHLVQSDTQLVQSDTGLMAQVKDGNYNGVLNLLKDDTEVDEDVIRVAETL